LDSARSKNSVVKNSANHVLTKEVRGSKFSMHGEVPPHDKENLNMAVDDKIPLRKPAAKR